MVKPGIKFFLVLASTCVTLAGDISFSQSSKPAAVHDQEVVARVNEYMDALAKLNRFRGTIRAQFFLMFVVTALSSK